MSVYVKLIASTPDADRVVAAAAKICYSPSGAAEILDGLDEDKTASFLSMLRKGDTFRRSSTLLHLCDRGAEPRRHAPARAPQGRKLFAAEPALCEMKGNCCIVPPSVAENAEAKAVFDKQAEAAFETYQELVALGVPREDARFILPHGFETRLVVTMNARELHHFFALRLCRRRSGRYARRRAGCCARRERPRRCSSTPQARRA